MQITDESNKKSNYLILGTCGFEREGKIVILNVSDSKKPFVCSEICENGTGVNACALLENNGYIHLFAGYENKRIDQYRLGL